jgi:hypothetical protein
MIVDPVHQHFLAHQADAMLHKLAWQFLAILFGL